MVRRKTKATRKCSPRKAPRRRTKARRKHVRRPRRWIKWLFLLLVGVGVVGFIYGKYLDHVVTTKFEGKRWAIPARVYARPLELYVGSPLTAKQFAAELDRLGYRKVKYPNNPGGYSKNRQRFLVKTRDFQFWDEWVSSQALEVRFDKHGLQLLRDAKDKKDIALLRLEPSQIGSIYPAHNEDRILVQRDTLPQYLVDSLMAVEDRSFYRHYGVDPKAILRAIWSNLKAGGVVQGGSTLTQQLVKNFYLSHERSLSRKLNEAAMAMLLEMHYGKDDILEAYTNEIYLGQDGRRAIHGFGLASQFYFSRPLKELDLSRIALLVGMVRGPSYYNPVRHPDRAKRRRDLVLNLLQQQGMISESEWQQATNAPLGLSGSRGNRTARGGYPAFMDVVRRQLHRDYQEEDLNSEGLRIFTSLDPVIQAHAQQAVVTRLDALEKSRKLPKKKLQAAVVVASTDGGELLAVVGGRNSRHSGFNRALSAERSVGSLIKPAVYLTALSKPESYNLLTGIDDKPVEITTQDGQLWTPQNFANESHGRVPLHTALAWSYNQATVHLGMDLGLNAVVRTLHALGIERHIDLYPSLLLGAISLSPLEMTQMYQTLATGGFRTPLKAIRAVTDASGQALSRYPLEVKRTVDPAATYLLDRVLQQVVRSGTGRSLSRWISTDIRAAGKTGTTDELRDSWFAGFTGDKVAVVWVGRDDNQPAGLTGGRGALQVWGDMMRRIQPSTLVLAEPDNIEMTWIDPQTGLRADESCEGARPYPFVLGSAPVTESPCMQRGSDIFGSFFE